MNCREEIELLHGRLGGILIENTKLKQENKRLEKAK